MRKHNRFTGGRFHKPTFKCWSCGRMTRDTGQIADGAQDMCRECYDIGGIDNMVNDNGFYRDHAHPEYVAARKECDQLLARIAALGGDVVAVRRHYDYIWGRGAPA